MKIFKSIFDTRIETLVYNPSDVIVSTNLNISNTVALVNKLQEKKVHPHSVFKMYRRWHIEFSPFVFDKIVQLGIIQ